MWRPYAPQGAKRISSSSSLDLLETLQEHCEQLQNVLVPLIVTMGIREEDLQTILMQYSLLKDTILSMVENLDAVEQYIIRQDDDEDEAVED